jgi:hypothetical protein
MEKITPEMKRFTVYIVPFDIVTVTKSRSTRCVGHVTCMGNKIGIINYGKKT